MPSNEIKLHTRLTDLNIWQFAKTNNYTILTFDEDFCELQNLYSFPPKIIWLRTGNVSTKEIADLLLFMGDAISAFLSDETLGVLELYLS